LLLIKLFENIQALVKALLLLHLIIELMSKLQQIFEQLDSSVLFFLFFNRSKTCVKLILYLIPSLVITVERM